MGFFRQYTSNAKSHFAADMVRDFQENKGIGPVTGTACRVKELKFHTRFCNVMVRASSLPIRHQPHAKVRRRRANSTSAARRVSNEVGHYGLMLSPHNECRATVTTIRSTLPACASVAVLRPFPNVAVQIFNACRCRGECAAGAQSAASAVCVR